MFDKYLNPNQREFIRAMAEAVTPKRKKRDPLAPKMIPAVAKRFHNFRPSYYTVIGLVTCSLQKVAISPVTGETVGYYDLIVREPSTGITYKTTYLYAFRDGAMKEVKKFDTRPLRG